MKNAAFGIFLSALAVVSGTAAYAAVQDSTVAQVPPTLPISAFADQPTFSRVRLSPDGQQLAFFSQFNGRKVAIVQNLDGSERIAVPPIEDADIVRVEWANNDRLLILYQLYARRSYFTRSFAETRLGSLSRDGQDIEWIVRPRKVRGSGRKTGNSGITPPFQGNIVSLLPEDPKHILLAVDSDLDAAAELRRINVKSGSYKELRGDARGIQDWYVDHSHTLRLASGWDPVNRDFIIRVFDGDGNLVPGAKTDWTENFDIAGFSEDPNIAYVRAVNDAGFSSLYTLDITSGEVTGKITPDQGIDTGGMVAHPETGLPAGYTYVDDHPKVTYLDKRLKRVQAIINKSIKGTNNRIVGKAQGKEIYIILSQSDTDPGSYYWYDRKAKKIAFVAPQRDAIYPEQMAKTKRVDITLRDGEVMPAYLTLPRGRDPKNLPAVVFPHGGPFGVRSDASWDPFIQFLANRGYAVLQPNFRGSGGYGANWLEAGHMQWGGRMQDDVTDATHWLIKEGYADAERLCIGGISYGGYTALMGAVMTPDLFKCAISGNGVTDMPMMKRSDNIFIASKEWQTRWGLEGADDAEISPWHQAEKIKIPILLFASKDDNRVPWIQSERMADRLKDLGKDVRFETADLGGHSMTTTDARARFMAAMEKILADTIGCPKPKADFAASP